MAPEPALRLSYRAAGSVEHVLGFGDSGPVLLIIPPLFDEMNRMRRTLVQAMRLLALRNVATRLIDLPGSNESLSPLEKQDLCTWRKTVTDAADQLSATHVLSLRGSALLDDALSLPRFRLAPVAGGPQLRALLRTRIAAEREAGRHVTQEELLATADAAPLELAGHLLGAALIRDLQIATPSETVPCTTLAIGEGGIAGSALWLRTEPGDDPELAASLAKAVAQWIETCAAS